MVPDGVASRLGGNCDSNSVFSNSLSVFSIPNSAAEISNLEHLTDLAQPTHTQTPLHYDKRTDKYLETNMDATAFTKVTR